MLKRSTANPIVAPEHVRPSRPDWKVDGTFNADVARVEGEVVMLVRVAESVADAGFGEVHVPLMEEGPDGWCALVRSFHRDDPAYDLSDTRMVRLRADPCRVHLTSMSHLRVARSAPGSPDRWRDRPRPMSGKASFPTLSCGALIEEYVLRVYYGGADRVMATGTVALDDLWAATGV